MILNSEYLELEGAGIKLTWGTDIEELHKQYGTKKLDEGDRTIYDWGE